MLSEGYIIIDEQKYPVFKIEVIPNTESNPELLKFKWEVTSMKGRTFSLKLRFFNAEAVSSARFPDLLRMTFYDP